MQFNFFTEQYTGGPTEPFDTTGRTLMFHGTVVEKHWPIHVVCTKFHDVYNASYTLENFESSFLYSTKVVVSWFLQ